MTINKTLDNDTMTVEIKGRLDTSSSPQLEAVVNAELNGVNTLIFDMEYLDYVSSAGLRVLLSAQKLMNSKSGHMIVRNVNETIMEVFTITGFSDILDIER